MKLWKFPDQVIRVAILFIFLITALVVVRARFVPETFGTEGHYRSAAVPIAAASLTPVQHIVRPKAKTKIVNIFFASLFLPFHGIVMVCQRTGRAD